MFENSKWIAAKERENEDGSYLLRKTFEIKHEVKKAIINVIGLGYGVYSINGNRVTSDVLTTPFTRFDCRVLYNSYDVTSMLKKGKNAFGAYIGNGWYNTLGSTWNYEKSTWRHHPKLIVQLDIQYYNGSCELIVSDTSWKTNIGPSVFNHIRSGECYDARLEIEGWDLPEFDDDLWCKAVICRGAGGIILPAKLPPIRIIRTLDAKYLGKGIFDFGENTSGWVKIRVKGEAGTRIKIVYSERLDRYGNIDNHHICSFTTGYLKQSDEYILKGIGAEEWEPNFVYHGFRYVKISDMPDDFQIVGRVVHTDLKTVGDFECSDDMLNKIHQATRRSTLTNFHSIPTDCPHREQNGWTGDALISCEQSLMNFDMISAYSKWLDDFKDVQRPNGQLPGIIPTSNWGYNWGSGPAWDSALIFIPWHTYQLTGDKSLIVKMWNNMKLYMEYLNSMADEHIVDFGLCDWAPPEGSVKCPVAVTDTAFYYADCCVMAKCAEIMGENSVKYKTLAGNIKTAYRESFKNEELEKSQTFLACGIYFGLYDEKEIPEKAVRLAQLVIDNNYHIACGTIGAKCIFSALSENGYAKIIYKMITNPTAPSYAFWINNGMTTLCETWSMEASLNHHMFSEVDYWFYKYVAGIRIFSDSILIKPCIELGLKKVKAKYRDIEVTIDNNKFIVKLPRSAKVVLGNREYMANEGVTTFMIP